MTSHYDNFQTAKKNVESTQKSKRENRRGQKIDRAKWRASEAEMSPPNSDKYREGWDRIFGRKRDNENDTGH